ncbi:unnamed protein product, partial [Tetraodon nigroviridis]
KLSKRGECTWHHQNMVMPIKVIAQFHKINTAPCFHNCLFQSI